MVSPSNAFLGIYSSAITNPEYLKGYKDGFNVALEMLRRNIDCMKPYTTETFTISTEK
jgi:hypothetical protein